MKQISRAQLEVLASRGAKITSGGKAQSSTTKPVAQKNASDSKTGLQSARTLPQSRKQDDDESDPYGDGNFDLDDDPDAEARIDNTLEIYRKRREAHAAKVTPIRPEQPDDLDTAMRGFFAEFKGLIEDLRQPSAEPTAPPAVLAQPVEPVEPKAISIDVNRGDDGLVTHLYVKRDTDGPEVGFGQRFDFIRSDLGLVDRVESDAATHTILRDHNNLITGIRISEE